MILIPNYCPAYSEQVSTDCLFIFDYLGRPYGVRVMDSYFEGLTDNYIRPWCTFLKEAYPSLPVKPHRMMYAVNS